MTGKFKEPLLEHTADEDHAPGGIFSSSKYLSQFLSNHSFFSSFVIGEDDIPPIVGVRGFYSAFKAESSKLWFLAGPAILTSIFQYSLGAITQTFAGHVGTLDLAAFSVENSVISDGNGKCTGDPLRAGVRGRADRHARRLHAAIVGYSPGHQFSVNVYVHICGTTIAATRQTEAISRTAGKFALWMIPQLYAYAVNFPIAKFLQAQSDIMAMAWISAAALGLHVLFSWLLMLKLGWGMAGGAVVLNISWWFLVVAQLIYIFSGACAKSWTGFSWKAFQNLWGFVRLSVASAVMLCLEVWYFTALILFAGYLKNAEVAVDALSICVNISGWISMIALGFNAAISTNIVGWAVMVAIGFNAAISVRVSNELGASHPRTAKFSVLVVVISAFVIGLLISIVLLIFHKQYPYLFSESSEVIDLVYQLTPLLAFCIVVNNVQPALSGVAIGAGWQALVAYVNIACYYVFGIPVGLIMGYALNMGVKGIWYGMVAGTVLQTTVLFWIVYKTNWNKEASAAAQRIKLWEEIKERLKQTTVEK
ncbi:UNVERIFIED_CONTAM: protein DETOXIFICATION 29 [Sesamum calycinum]|uniref:Protein DETOXIFICATION n=1 Tax=Sesamum calycinum TaxID=2727403 RepID=A0AAW2PQN3_9LAMI